YAPNNPVSYKPGGFANGAGHGSTVLGPQDQYWHFATAAVAVSIGWERRISMFPTYFDDDGMMYVNTAFGDYPHYAPAIPGRPGEFTGWMLLSHNKPVKSSSSKKGFDAQHVTDENIKTFWLAESNGPGEWLEIDLQRLSQVFAVQVNYHDHESGLYGKIPGLYHRYVIEGSEDGNNWKTLVDKSENYKDVPNDYVELHKPFNVRFVRFRNIHVPTPALSISGLRIFGKGMGKPPGTVKNLEAKRRSDRREATISWSDQPGSQGYNVYWGIAPTKLYSSWMVYGETTLNLRSLNTDQTYYFSIEAFNENGVSKRSKVIKAE
ncbi:MAG: discoidin domain-containing protein, partial [Cytophagales bacterium]|nr:discoidin domain-containing protein [Cytophagales bacterium]